MRRPLSVTLGRQEACRDAATGVQHGRPAVPQVEAQFAIAVLPIGLMFASFGPLFFFASWLERARGIPHNSPIKNHPNGILWSALLLSAMVVLVVLSYLLGWLANGLISRYALGWPASKVVAVYMRSEVPQEWLTLPRLKPASAPIR